MPNLVPAEVQPTPALTALRSAEARSLKALSGWSVAGKTLPPGLTLAAVRSDHAALKRALEPVEPRALAVILDGFLAYCETVCDMPTGDRRTALYDAYMAGLIDVPEDLCAAAVERVKRTYRWPKPPKVADLRHAIEQDWLDRRKAESLLDRAALVGIEHRPPAPKPDAETMAAMSRKAEEVRAHLRAAAAKFEEKA